MSKSINELLEKIKDFEKKRIEIIKFGSFTAYDRDKKIKLILNDERG